jgi:nitroreductase
MSDLETLSTIIRTRRSVKPVDLDPVRPVDRALLETLLTNATWAPTHGLTEPWRFDVLLGNSRNELADAMQRIYRDVTPPSEFREDKFQKMGDTPRLAPAIIAVSVRLTSGGKIPEIEEVEAVACAVQNLLLSATAVGLASFWSSPPLLDSAAFKVWLGVSEQDRVLGLICLGWPKQALSSYRSVRKPLDACVTWRD